MLGGPHIVGGGHAIRAMPLCTQGGKNTMNNEANACMHALPAAPPHHLTPQHALAHPCRPLLPRCLPRGAD
jgi:hypothetical protein